MAASMNNAAVQEKLSVWYPVPSYGSKYSWNPHVRTVVADAFCLFLETVALQSLHQEPIGVGPDRPPPVVFGV